MNNPFRGWCSVKRQRLEMPGRLGRRAGFSKGQWIPNRQRLASVRDAVITGAFNMGGLYDGLLVVVCRSSRKTWDGGLNDINGFHVPTEHAFTPSIPRMEEAVEEGAVSRGERGLMRTEFNGGRDVVTQTRRRKSAATLSSHGALNYEPAPTLRIAGSARSRGKSRRALKLRDLRTGWTVVRSSVVLERMPRCSHSHMKPARSGGFLRAGRHGSNLRTEGTEIFHRFSTAPRRCGCRYVRRLKLRPTKKIEPSLAQRAATEDAIIHAILPANMTGIENPKSDRSAHAGKGREVLKKYNRVVQ